MARSLVTSVELQGPPTATVTGRVGTIAQALHSGLQAFGAMRGHGGGSRYCKSVVTGGPSKHEGRDLHEAHADLHITEEAFDRVAGHLQATLQELEIQQEDQQAILAAVQARRDEVVTFEKSI
jgi:hypothetical protein